MAVPHVAREARGHPFQVEIAGVLYIGEFDGDGEDKGDDVIVELKTTSEDISSGAPYWRRIAQVDPQVTTYLMAARAQGRPLKRVVYDVIRKVTMERAMATPLDKRKYTKVTKKEPPRLYANMRETDETDDENELRILEDIENSRTGTSNVRTSSDTRTSTRRTCAM